MYDPESSEDVILDIPVVIKATGTDENRTIEVEASCEKEDSEGDIILQKALLDSAGSFIASGHFDIDHKSEHVVAHKLGITNPEYYIVGYPGEVIDMGEGRTGVRGTILRNSNGEFDPRKYLYDYFWASLRTNPPVRWRASVFGKAVKVQHDKSKAAKDIITELEWKSLAFTRKPINDHLTGYAKIITAKSFVTDFIKSGMNSEVFNREIFTRDALTVYAHNLMSSGSDCSVWRIREDLITKYDLCFNDGDILALAVQCLISWWTPPDG